MTRLALALVLVAVLLLGGCDDDEPAATRPEPAPAPSAVPWWEDGVLHVGGTEIDSRFRELVFRGGTSVVGRGRVDGSTWSLVTDGHLVPLVRSDGLVRPVVSSDGTRVVWVEETDAEKLSMYRSRIGVRVVAYDVADRRELGTWSTTATVTCCDGGGMLTVMSVGTDGRVVLERLGQGSVVWAPGREPVRMRGPGLGSLSWNGWPGGVMWQGHGRTIFELPGRYGSVDEQGRIRPVGTMPIDQGGAWSDDGSAYAYPGNASGEALAKDTWDHLWVQGTDGSRVELRPDVPEGASATIVAWEAADTVLLSLRRPYGDGVAGQPGLVGLVRCDAGTGACERTADRPGRRARLPEVV